MATPTDRWSRCWGEHPVELPRTQRGKRPSEKVPPEPTQLIAESRHPGIGHSLCTAPTVRANRQHAAARAKRCERNRHVGWIDEPDRAARRKVRLGLAGACGHALGLRPGAL